MKKNKITLINMITSMILQIAAILSGFILPRIILSCFGSETNGLISSITQLLSYITLVEGGISGVITASMYQPINNNDVKKISSIMKTASNFYKKIGLIFMVYTLLVAFIYPIVFDLNFSYMYIWLLIIILSLNNFIQYMFSLSYRNLLIADKQVYVVSITQTVIIFANIFLAILSVKIYPSIHFLKLITGLTFLLQPIVYKKMLNKRFKFDDSCQIDNNLLKSRWNGFAVNIAAFIHLNTDVFILTVFTDLKVVSIYSVYALVTNGLRQLIQSICNGICPTIGHAYAKGNITELKFKLDLYEYIIFILVFFLFSVGILIIVPFIMVYTNDITDTNYYQPVFAILLMISEALYLIKIPHLDLSYAANKFKEITVPCYIEAFLNLVISSILVYKIGLVGVVVGTIIGMIYRMLYQVYLTKKMIPGRKQRIFYKKLILFVIATALGMIICLIFIPKVKYTMFSCVVHAIIYSIIMIIVYLIVTLIFFKKEFSFFKKYLKI